MSKQELAWKRFWETGSVSAYLAYCRSTACAETEGDLQNVDLNRRNHSKSEEFRE